jgi:hypothetical protein
MAEAEINKDFCIDENFCFDSKKKLTVEIAHKALKTYHEKFLEALDLEKNSIPIILDTNVLLGYYGMSQDDKNKFIDFLNENKDRVFLTSQVQEEFLRNRRKVINEEFFKPLKTIPEEFIKMYQDAKHKFTSFFNDNKVILRNNYPTIWKLLSQKEQKLNEIFADEEILGDSLAEEVKITRRKYQDAHFLDELLETCTNLKVTPPLNDKEVEFLKKQYDALAKKYKDVNQLEMKEKITFPGWGDNSGKEDPYGDFIIFHEILKFMFGEKDGLNKKDVIFLTCDEKKGDWFHKERLPIIHYIEKAFLLTDKSLFIIHPDQPLKISFKKISQSKHQELPIEILPEDELTYTIGRNGLLCKNWIVHYRGWTILITSESNNQAWDASAVGVFCDNYPEFKEACSDGNIASIILEEWLETREEAYTAIIRKINNFFERA